MTLQFPSVASSSHSNDIRNVLSEELFMASEIGLENRLRVETLQGESVDESTETLPNEGNENIEAGKVEQPSTWKFISPADIYSASVMIKPRLQFLADLLLHRPSLKECYASTLNQRTHELKSDILLFEILLEEMVPKVAQMRDSKQAGSWSAQVDKVLALFHSLKGLVTNPKEGEKIAQFQAVLRKFNIMKCFLSHIGQEDLVLPDAVLNRIYISLNSNALKTETELKKFIKHLHMANEESIRHHFTNGTDVCMLCAEDFEKKGNIPVELPCSHLGCKSCFEEYFEDKGDGKEEYENPFLLSKLS